jgi:hypothetical protein
VNLSERDPLGRAQQLSAQMLDHARRGEWDQVAELDPVRSAVLAALPGATAADLHSLLEQNHELVALAADARARVATEMRGRAHAQRALNAYLDAEEQ